jgi:hypothetical protein
MPDTNYLSEIEREDGTVLTIKDAEARAAISDMDPTLQQILQGVNDIKSSIGDVGEIVEEVLVGPPTLIEKTITENGTYDASDDEADGYSSVTVDVSGSGGSSGTDVIFYDYDGSVVASYSAADFSNLSAMPENPTHTGLTAQGWNWTLSDAKAYVASYGKLNIGQMYITSDGKTRLHFVVPKDNLGIELYLYLDDDTELDIDWGDDSEHTRCTSSDTKYHNYDSAGRHDVTITVINGSFEFAVTYDGDNFTLQNVEIGNGVTLIRDFTNCYTLTSITIPNGVTSIGGSAFSNCYALTSITIPNSVTNLDAYDHSFIFNNCYALTSITIPNEVTSIEDHAFQNCYALSSITIPNNVTSIGYCAFQDCYALSSITIPNNVTSIGYGAFQDCYALSSITIPNSVTTIQGTAFYECYALSSVTIPSSVTSIGSEAFRDCYALSSITFEPTTPPTLSGDLNLPTTCIIRVPQGTLSDYTSASNYPDPSQYIYEEY